MSGWSKFRIKDLGRVVTGKTPPTEAKELFDGDELFVSPKDLSWDQYFVTETETRVSEKAFAKFKNQVLPANTVMFTSLSFAFGKMGLTSRPSLTNQQINSVIVKSDHDFRFVFYLLKAYKEIIFSYNSGIDTPIVPKSVFEGIEVLCPPKATQQKISAILSTYDDLIANNQRRITLLERMAEDIYREWFVRLRFPGHDDVKVEKGVPEGWSLSPSNEAFDILGGGTPNTDEPMFWTGPIPFFTPKDATENFYALTCEKHISEKGLNACSSQLFPKHTIFITARGTVGKLALAASPMAMNQSCYALRPKQATAVYCHYMAIRDSINYIKSVSKSGVFDNIVMDTFKNVPLLLPPPVLMEKFNLLVESFFTQIANLLERNLLLATARDSLLPRLISGKLSVNALDIRFPPGMQEPAA